MIDESGFEWKTVVERDDDTAVVVDRDGTRWTVPSPNALAEMRGTHADVESAPPRVAVD